VDRDSACDGNLAQGTSAWIASPLDVEATSIRDSVEWMKDKPFL
jgi:hypothetical protein